MEMYTLKEYMNAWIEIFSKIRTGTWCFDSPFMEGVKICNTEDGGCFKHLLKRS